MRRLILFRHAKAEAKAAGTKDFARALDREGLAEALATGRWLAAQGFVPDLVLVSSSRRTRQTWEAVAPLLPETRLSLLDGLYDAMPEEIVEAIEAVAEQAETLMVIAHNPGLQEVAVDLLSETGRGGAGLETVSAGFPTGAAAVLDMSGESGPHLEAMFSPHKAREGEP